MKLNKPEHFRSSGLLSSYKYESDPRTYRYLNRKDEYYSFLSKNIKHQDIDIYPVGVYSLMFKTYVL